MSDIFISYSSEDLSRIQPLITVLERRGWSVWWDRNIPPGTVFADVIEKEMNAARCTIVVWSKNSISSLWIRTEASVAQSRNNLIPVLIDDVKVPFEFSLIQAAYLPGWDGRSPSREADNLFKAISTTLERSHGGNISDSSINSTISQPDSSREELEKELELIPRPPLIDQYYWTPPMDVDTLGGQYIVTMDLPGVSMDELEIEIQSSALIVSGVRRTLIYGDQESLYRERKGSRFFRKITLPKDISKKGIEPDYRDGVLRIIIRD
jgi:HSP20 family molecular chaperone IbpA